MKEVTLLKFYMPDHPTNMNGDIAVVRPYNDIPLDKRLISIKKELARMYKYDKEIYLSNIKMLNEKSTVINLDNNTLMQYWRSINHVMILKNGRYIHRTSSMHDNASLLNATHPYNLKVLVIDEHADMKTISPIIKDKMELFTYIDDIDVTSYYMKDEKTGKLDIETLFDTTGSNNKNNIYCIMLTDDISLSLIKKILVGTRKRKNFIISAYSKDTFYNITEKDNDIVFTKLQ